MNAGLNADDLPAFLDPLLAFLSSSLPSPLYSVALSLLTNLYALSLSLLSLFRFLLTTPPALWDAERVLPPLITLLVSYLALLSFYRTTGWMVRTTLAFAKWGALLAAVGAAAGYFLANANPGAGVDAAQLGGGIGGLLLGLLGAAQNGANSNRRPRTRTNTAPRPKAWENWDKHADWQYSENAQDADKETAGQAILEVQEAIAGMVHAAGNAIKESGWWESVKGAADELGRTKEEAGKRNKKSSKKTEKEKSRSR